MHLEEIELKANDGLIFTVRSLEGHDAQAAIAFMGTIYAESPYLSRYVDEWTMGAEDERLFLERAHSDGSRLMIGAFCAGELIAIADCYPISPVSKMAHRSSCSIAIDRAFHGLGIGTAMMRLLITGARRIGYEQMELEVAAENEAAMGLYAKLGFVEWGRLPNGFRYRDRSYSALVSMVLTL